VILNYCRNFRGLYFLNRKQQNKTASERYKCNSQNFTACRISAAECSATSSCTPFLVRKQFYFVVSCLKIIGHGHPDNNLESHFMSDYSRIILQNQIQNISLYLYLYSNFALGYRLLYFICFIVYKNATVLYFLFQLKMHVMLHTSY
jgi:hypothetical protein